MALKDLLRDEADHAYQVAQALFKMVDGESLGWKPATGSNWMTVGQLLMHCSSACGAGIRGFVTGDWGLPEGMTFEDLPPEQGLPPAEKMPAAESVEQALELLEKDRAVAHEYVDQLDEAALTGAKTAAPWGGPELTLFQHLLHMVGHLEQHKGQLFYYLKLQGRDVNTFHLWGV